MSSCYTDTETSRERLSILPKVHPRAVCLPNSRRERSGVVGAGRKGKRKVKEDEAWIRLYSGGMGTHSPSSVLSFPHFRRIQFSLADIYQSLHRRSVGSNEVLDVVSLLVTLLPGRKWCQATEYSDSQNWTPVAWAGGLEVRRKGLAETNCHLPPFFPRVSPEGLKFVIYPSFRKKSFLKGGAGERWVVQVAPVGPALYWAPRSELGVCGELWATRGGAEASAGLGTPQLCLLGIPPSHWVGPVPTQSSCHRLAPMRTRVPFQTGSNLCSLVPLGTGDGAGS